VRGHRTGPPLAPGERCAADCKHCDRQRVEKLCSIWRTVRWAKKHRARHRRKCKKAAKKFRNNHPELRAQHAAAELRRQRAIAIEGLRQARRLGCAGQGVSILSKRQLESPKYIVEIHGRRFVEIWLHEEPVND
jgi:hypothetical protein